MAIDIGGTNIKAGMLAEDGDIFKNKTIATPVAAGREEFLKSIVALVESMGQGFAGLGISVLGAWSSEKRRVLGACENLPVLEGWNFADELQNIFRVPVVGENDVNAAAIGEAFFGAGKALPQFFCVALGTGIGGAYVVHKQLIKGASGLAGEVGYLKTAPGSVYEERASARALLNACRTVAAPDKADREIFADAFAGAPRYQSILQQWLHEVATGICQIIYVLDPGTVLVGGGISGLGRALTEKVQKEVDAQLLPDFAGKTKILPAQLGNAACLLGAVAPFLQGSTP